MLVLHIGLPKAGSTTLQHALAANADLLESRGVRYAVSGRSGVAHHRLNRAARTADADWGLLRREVLDHEGTTVVSSEGFIGTSASDVRALCGSLPVRIVCYLREQAARMPSSYAQKAKYGVTLGDFDSFFEEEHRRRPWAYADLLRTWVDAFGTESVRVRSLDAGVLVGGDVVADFLEGVLGVSSTDLAPISRRNESPPWQLVELLRDLHRGIDGDLTGAARQNDRALMMFARQLLAFGQASADALGWTERGRYLSREQIDVLSAKYESDRSVLSAMGIDCTLVPAGDHPPRDMMPSPDRVPPAERHEFLRELLPRTITYFLRR